MSRPVHVDPSPQKHDDRADPQQGYLFAAGGTAAEGQVLRYTPVEALPASAPTTQSCGNCRHKENGCRVLCKDIKKVLPNDRTGRGRREFSNERDLESHPKPVALPSSPDFNRLPEVPHIFTRRELQAIRLLHEGKSRTQVRQLLDVSDTRVSQLVRGALRRYDEHDARLRALTALALKRLGGSAFEEGHE